MKKALSLRERLILDGTIVPADMRAKQDGPSPQAWRDEPTLRLDRLAHLATSELRHKKNSVN